MKVQLTYQWMRQEHDGLGDASWEIPAAELKTIVVDTTTDRRYDGAKSVEDVARMFLETSYTPNPEHGFTLKLVKCSEL